MVICLSKHSYSDAFFNDVLFTTGCIVIKSCISIRNLLMAFPDMLDTVLLHTKQRLKVALFFSINFLVLHVLALN